ncbi:MAG TPA: oxidoreductase [Myxococcaceae bacterium]|jgi:ferredoxin-NADP reductase
MSAEAPVRKKPVEYEPIVTEVRMETHDTATLFLDFGDAPREYKAGQFLNIDPHQFRALAPLAAFLQEQKGRRELHRSYSLSSAPHEPLVAITVKDEPFIPGLTKYPALIAPYLVNAPLKGTRMRVMGFMGPYTLPDDVEQRTDYIVHIAAGSGAVPNLSVIKDALHRGLKLRHIALFSNKTWGDILFREQFDALEAAHPDKLRVVHCLTRETDEARFSAKVRKGRVSQALIEELIPEPERKSCLVYTCGPAITPWERRKAMETRTPATPRFMETVLGHLHTLGIEDKRIKREVYG